MDIHSPDPELPIFVDSTMLSCARSCLQKFYNEFVLGLRPGRKSIDLHAGAVFASTLEHFHRSVWDQGKPQDEAIARAHLHFIQEWGDFQSEKETPKTPDNMWDALVDYIYTYPPLMDHVQPYRVDGKSTCEFTFAIPLALPGFPLHPVTNEPFIYCGRADLLGSYKGRVCIRDEKTTNRLDSNWTEKWDLRAQFMGYCWAAQQGGLDCDTVVIRGIIIYKEKKPRQVEAIKFYPKWQIDRWLEVTRRTLIEIVSAWKEGYWQYNLGDACTQYGNCAFLPLCTIPPDQREVWTSNYLVSRWNPLLRDPVATTALTGPETAPSPDAATTQPESSILPVD